MESDSEGEEAEMGQRQQRSRTRSRSGPRNDQRQVVKQPFVIVRCVLTILGQGRRGQAAAQVGQFVAAAQGHVGNAIGRDPVQVGVDQVNTFEAD